jgi:hypothetical protein
MTTKAKYLAALELRIDLASTYSELDAVEARIDARLEAGKITEEECCQLYEYLGIKEKILDVTKYRLA